ncbi:MAG TPA: ABC transporter permease, partial [Sphingobacteriaceae bacterium]
MALFSQIKFLIGKEMVLEWRSKYAINGILLYVVSTIFVCYLSFRKTDPVTWNALFWIIMLFASVNAISKSFVQENRGRQLYYYTLASAQAIIL